MAKARDTCWDPLFTWPPPSPPTACYTKALRHPHPPGPQLAPAKALTCPFCGPPRKPAP